MSRHDQYANPRRNLTNTAEQFARQDRAAAALGLTWSEWVRQKTECGPDARAQPRKIKVPKAHARTVKIRNT